MNERELDRLVSFTELSPAAKRALRVVRHGVMSGKVDGPSMSRYSWSVCVEDSGVGKRFRFSMKKDANVG